MSNPSLSSERNPVVSNRPISNPTLLQILQSVDWSGSPPTGIEIKEAIAELQSKLHSPSSELQGYQNTQYQGKNQSLRVENRHQPLPAFDEAAKRSEYYAILENGFSGRKYPSHEESQLRRTHNGIAYTHRSFTHDFKERRVAFCHVLLATIDNASNDLPPTLDAEHYVNKDLEALELRTPKKLNVTNQDVRLELEKHLPLNNGLYLSSLEPAIALATFEQQIRRLHEEYRRLVDEITIDLSKLTVEEEAWLRLIIFTKRGNQFLSLEATEYQTVRVKWEDQADKDYKTFAAKRPDWGRLLDETDLLRLMSLRDGLHALTVVLDTDLKEAVDTFRKIELNDHTLESIPFIHLWFLFPPGMEIVIKKPRGIRVYAVLQSRASEMRDNSSGAANPRWKDHFSVEYFSLEYDGKDLGAVSRLINITPYSGYRRIASLPAFPLGLLRECTTRGALIDRGTRFARLVSTRFAHKKYHGPGYSLKAVEDSDSPAAYEEVDGEVVIDFDLAFHWQRGSTQINRPTFMDTKAPFIQGRNYGPAAVSDLVVKQCAALLSTITSGLTDFRQNLSGVKPEALILLPFVVYGYSLFDRKLLVLDVEKVEDIVAENNSTGVDGFADLVLPEGYKEIVRALVFTHAKVRKTIGSEGLTIGDEIDTDKQREFDLVKGKGKGLIILLHGAPGVGKTSTAECVAANTGRPLFPITCGDVGGDSAQEVEKNLEGFFDLARRWGCVLLLDEADVFLTERRKGDIKQNSLVSVFLRVLEYYSGILILTTNRVGEFDEAIKSRIHCPLYYPPLTEENTNSIWRLNLRRLEAQVNLASINSNISDGNSRLDFNSKAIMAFARKLWADGVRWNGRQIRNAFQTAVALAEYDHLRQDDHYRATNPPHLTEKHFTKVALANKDFERYLLSVHTMSDNQRLRMMHLRNDTHAFDRDRTAWDAPDPSLSATGRPITGNVVSTGWRKLEASSQTASASESGYGSKVSGQYSQYGGDSQNVNDIDMYGEYGGLPAEEESGDWPEEWHASPAQGIGREHGSRRDFDQSGGYQETYGNEDDDTIGTEGSYQEVGHEDERKELIGITHQYERDLRSIEIQRGPGQQVRGGLPQPLTPRGRSSFNGGRGSYQTQRTAATPYGIVSIGAVRNHGDQSPEGYHKPGSVRSNQGRGGATRPSGRGTRGLSRGGTYPY